MISALLIFGPALARGWVVPIVAKITQLFLTWIDASANEDEFHVQQKME